MRTLKNIVVVCLALAFLNGAALAADNVTSIGDKGWGMRLAYSPTFYNLSLDKKSIPVHPGDSGFLKGNTDVQVGSGIDWTSFTIGIQKKFLVNNSKTDVWKFNPKIGIDADLSFLASQGRNSDGSGSSLYQYKQANGDTRPPSQGSFVYDKFYPGIIAPVPFIGLDIQKGKWVFSGELGLAYKELKREYGWHRFGQEEKLGGNDEWCASLRPALGLSYQADEFSVGVMSSYEQYSTSFGAVSGTKIMILFKFAF